MHNGNDCQNYSLCDQILVTVCYRNVPNYLLANWPVYNHFIQFTTQCHSKWFLPVTFLLVIFKHNSKKYQFFVSAQKLLTWKLIK